MSDNSVLRKATSAISWTFALDLAGRLVAIAVAIVSARVFTPEIFGLYAITFAVRGFFNFLTLGGLFIAIINNEKYQATEYKQTAWTFEIFLINQILTVAVVASAFIAPGFYSIPEIKHYLLFLALVPFIQSFQTYYNFDLLIGLKYKELFKFKVVPQLIKSVTAISLLLWLESIWALLIPEVLGVFVLTLFSHILSKGKLKFRTDTARFKELWSFSKHVLLSRILNSFRLSLDKLVLGKLFSVSSLGYYQVGEKIGNQVTNAYYAVVNKALYPVISKAKNENSDSSIIVKLTIEVFILLLCPALLVLAFFSLEVITTIFGDQWRESQPVFLVFLLVIVFRLKNNTIALYYLGLGHPRVQARMNGIYLITFLVSIGLLFSWGIVYAALSVFLAELAASIYSIITKFTLKVDIGLSRIMTLYAFAGSCLVIFIVHIEGLASRGMSLAVLMIAFTLLLIGVRNRFESLSLVKSIYKRKLKLK